MNNYFSSFSKLNLSLYVGHLNNNGRHGLVSIFQEIDIYDEILITKATTQQHTVTFIEQNIPESNTCTKIIDKIKDKLSSFWSITITKHIPCGSGLGGGSSNAATLLNALCKLENINLSLKEKTDLVKDIGSDIPFFLRGGTAMISGDGDMVQPLTKMTGNVVVIFPNISCSTKDVYQAFDTLGKFDNLSSLSNRDKHKIGHNSLYPAAASRYPKLQLIKNELTSLISEPIYFSGSGSTFYVLCASEEQQSNVYYLLKSNTNWKAKTASFINAGTEGRN